MKPFIQWAAISAVVLAFASPALALNPQPEPPGKAVVRANGAMMSGHATTAVHANGAAEVGDEYCGTPVPGHPHPKACTAVHTNTMGGTMTGHANTVVHTGGANAADVDDNYCGTPVPGHPHVNATGAAAAHCNANTHVQGAATGH